MSKESMQAAAQEIRKLGIRDIPIPDKYLYYARETRINQLQITTRYGSCLVYEIQAKEPRSQGFFINLHGGGFVQAHSNIDIAFSQRIAIEAKVTVYDVDYQLAPEAQFPTAVYEVFDVVTWVANLAERRKEKFALGGHSAGGSLAAAAVLLSNRRRMPLPELLILDYPFLDAVTDPADKPPVIGCHLPIERMRLYNELYFENEQQRRNPLASAVCTPLEQLRGFPKTIMNLAGYDILKTEGDVYGKMLAQAGVPVEVHHWDKSSHGFMVHFTGQYEEAVANMTHQLYNIIGLS